ncbi:unnamed protein product, partial [Ectocarpus sp. 6 AP-2014]
SKQEKAAFERSSAINGDMCVQIRTQRRRRGKGNSSCLRRGEDKSDSTQHHTDRQQRDAGGPRVYRSTSSATAAHVVRA